MKTPTMAMLDLWLGYRIERTERGMDWGEIYWPHGRKRANHSKYSPQEEDRKHNFVRRKVRNARGEP